MAHLNPLLHIRVEQLTCRHLVLYSQRLRIYLLQGLETPLDLLPFSLQPHELKSNRVLLSREL